MAEGPGPGAGDAGVADVAGLQQLQGGEELALEERLAAPVAGQGRQRGQQRTLAEDPPVVAFHAPHRHHRVLVHAVARGHLVEQLVVLGEHRLAIADPLLVHQTGQVVPQRGGELRLRVEQVEHAEVGLQAAGEALITVGGNALRLGLLLQAGEAGREARGVGLRQGQGG